MSTYKVAKVFVKQDSEMNLKPYVLELERIRCDASLPTVPVCTRVVALVRVCCGYLDLVASVLSTQIMPASCPPLRTVSIVQLCTREE
jgi:hypothetical protein